MSTRRVEVGSGRGPALPVLDPAARPGEASGARPSGAGGAPGAGQAQAGVHPGAQQAGQQAAQQGPHPAPPADGAGMRDGFGRSIEYLRISVTDKCNLRCVYCMPPEGLEWLRRGELLSFEEIEALVRTMAAMGLRRLRLTGGEPLVRRDLPRLIERLARIEGIDDIALSTNAVLLAPLAERLRGAGLSRVNVSLDSLRAERVEAIARRAGTYRAIMEGLEAAERAGLMPLKINTVVLRGSNDDEIADFARQTRERPWHVRFIEVMPTGANLEVSAAQYVPAAEILARVRRLGALEPLGPEDAPPGNGPARYFRYPGAAGTVGVITPMSHNYCASCNRMRLTADGQLRPCLFGTLQTDLRGPLRRGEAIEPHIRRTLEIKPERHHLVQGSAAGSGGLAALSQVGG